MQINKYELNDVFDRNYECKILDSQSMYSGTQYCYPGCIENSYFNGLQCEILPYSEKHDKWIASFMCGKLSPNALTGIYTHPSPQHLLIVAKGEAYIVDVENPFAYEHIKMVPVMGVVAARDAKTIVLYDFTRCEGYGELGLHWRTPSLSWDGLRNVFFDGKRIVGEGWDAPNDTWVKFDIDPQNGLFTGGASPKLIR